MTRNKVLITLIVLLAGLSVYLFAEKQDMYFKYLYERAVPHIELGHSMVFYGVDMWQGKVLESSNSGDIAYGKITGFVRFTDTTKQPRGAWQYYSIIATDMYDENQKQVFALIETLKLPAVPPKVFDAQELRVLSDSATDFVLSDEDGGTYRILKRSNEVFINDLGGDSVKLITSNSNYRDFMVDFLKN